MTPYIFRILKLNKPGWIKYLLSHPYPWSTYVVSSLISGISVSLTKSIRRPLIDFYLQGNTVQDGVPTPESPVDIVSAGENGTITIIKANKDSTLSKTYTIPVQAPFRKIGAVQDDFVQISNKWYERHNFDKYVLDGVDNQLTTKSATTSNVYWTTDLNVISPASDDILSNYFEKKPQGTLYNSSTTGICWYNNRIRCGFGADSELTTKELVNEWLEAHNTEVIYILVEPTLLPCTSGQVRVLEEIIEDGTYAGQTNYSSSDSVSPIINVKYWKESN